VNSEAAALEAAGMSVEAAARTGHAFDRLRERLEDASSGPRCGWFVPGRIEMLGKHTDYAGGRALVCAAERGFAMMAAARSDSHVVVLDAASGERARLDLAPFPSSAAAGWSRYAETVVRRVARNFPDARRGADIVFESDLPRASGMSSSSALMIAVFLALADVNRLAADPAYEKAIRTTEDLASYLAALENGQSFKALAGDRGVGTQGGSEDHTAILCSTAGSLGQYGFAPVCLERRVPLEPTWTFAIAVSGVPAEKTGTARERYNELSTATSLILQRWHERTGRADATLAAAVRSAPDAPSRLRGLVANPPDQALIDRLEQFVEESETIVPQAAERLARKDYAALGSLVDRSQRLAEERLRNQVPETMALVRTARSLGAPAASAFGAGFGGSVWALVPRSSSVEFLDRWRGEYLRLFPAHATSAEFFVTHAGPAALRV
jgi:galactokinase